MLLAVATPTHMMEPVKAGTLNVVRVKNRKRIMPQSAAGSAVMMMNGSSHDWKFTTISMYTRTMENPRPANSPTYDVCMVSSCPRMWKKLPLGSRCSLAFTMRAISKANEHLLPRGSFVGLHDPRDIVSNPVEVAT